MDVREQKNERMRAWRNGWTVPQLRAFMDEHGRRCGICEAPEDSAKRSGGLVIDHDHKCCSSQAPRVAVVDRPSQLCGGCARGLLCYSCNTAIGQLADDPDRFQRALIYLARDRRIGPIIAGPEHSRRPRGASHHRARLDEDVVRAIRSTYARGGTTHRALAEQYGVSESTVQAVLRRLTWKHVG